MHTRAQTEAEPESDKALELTRAQGDARPKKDKALELAKRLAYQALEVFTSDAWILLTCS